MSFRISQVEMSCSGSSKSDAKTGKRWTSRVKFDPFSDERSGETYIIEDGSLIEQMTDLIDDREMIKQIFVYKCPLFSWQRTQFNLNHQFIMLETNKWWRSIEKNDKHILLQRSKSLSWVRDFRSQTRRNTPLKQLSYDKGQKSMKDFVGFLYSKDELNKPFDWIDNNCKDFAKRVFDKFAAKTKYH